ncbi:hypothetical protein ES703_31243 [subsurface metagenome]
MVKKRKLTGFCPKNKFQYEITISGGNPDDYGMPTNPPIVTCAQNKKAALKQFKFPKKVKVREIKRV